MEAIHALSIAPAARDWLAHSRRPGILHVFDEACNLINERQEVLSVVIAQIGNGPFSLTIDQPLVFTRYLDIESQISFDRGCLRVGKIQIDTENAKLWTPSPDWEMLHARRNEILDQLMRSSITDYEILLPHSLLSTLSSALVDSDISAALAVTSRLAGLGAGLTPAGDDFVMGAVLAVWILHPPEIAKVIAEELANTAAPLTTSLSAAWLRSAGRGEAGILWHEFFDTLISADTIQIQEAINKILAVGDTSGADALAGFVQVCTYWSERASSKFH